MISSSRWKGRILGKPGTVARAIEQLECMAGRSHELITALVVICRGQAIESHRPDPDADAALEPRRDRTLRGSRPAPGLRRELQAGGAWDRALRAGSRPRITTAITGLPLIRLTGILRGLGFTIP